MRKLFNIAASVVTALILMFTIYNPYDKPNLISNDNAVIKENEDDFQDTYNQDTHNNEDDFQDTYNQGTHNNDDQNTVVENPSPTDEFIYVDNGLRVQALVNLNVRKKPSTDSEKAGMLSVWDVVPYVDTYDKNWYKVYYNNAAAYVSANSSYSKIIDKDALNSVQQKIEKVISVGMGLLGTPYEYGSQRILLYNGNVNPNFTGNTFDCSAFVQYIFYKGANVKLKGDSRSQSVQGIAVDVIQRGDVIFMTSTERYYNTGIERIGHVAVYVGNNKLLHTYGEGGVRITDYSAFWKDRTIMAKRMIY
jgi:cell wall-associated NlpC family hydrolase